ncbi:MAG: DsbC family protein [Nitrospirota bacterium]
MKVYTAILIGFVLVFLSGPADAFKLKKGQQCMDCHKLKQKDAEKIIEKAVPGGKIMAIKDAPAKGLWQIDVQRGEQKGSLYIDYSKKYLTGQVIPIESIGKQPPQRKVDVSKISLKNAVTLGTENAKKTIIVFTDPDCPYCRQLHTIIKQILIKRTDIAFAIIPLALPMHPDANKKVQSILCSKSKDILDDAFAGKEVPAPTCKENLVGQNNELAKTLEFNGTPTLVRDDGVVLSGYLPEEKLIEWIDRKQPK